MQTRHLLALCAAGLAAVSVIGCGPGTDTGSGGNGGGSGGSGGAGGDPMTTTPSTTTPSTTTPTMTPTSDGNDSFEEAQELAVNEPDAPQPEFVSAELSPIETDNDYYKLTGKAGDFLYFATFAKTLQGSPDPFVEGRPDLVITLYDSTQKQIAQNDDPIPRGTQDSSLYTVLPADGEYFVKVEEYCQVLGASGQGCDQAYFDAMTDTAYNFAIFRLDPASDGTVSEPAADDDMMQYPIDPAEYVENTDSTGYFAVSINGTFKDDKDVDVYTFTVPNAIPITDGRETAVFEIFPTGVNANGSTVPTGKVWVEDMMGTRLGEVDGAHLDPIDGYPLEVPLKFGDQYTLHVESGGMPGANGFYVVLHYRSGSNPIEVGDVDPMTNNDDIMKPEHLMANMSGGGFSGGFVAGELTMGDVDYFQLDAIPNAGDKVYAVCTAWRAGSGLRDLKLSLFDADTGMAIPAAIATETADAVAALDVEGVALGATTNVILKVEGTQDAIVKGTYYSCGVVFFPPMP